MSKQFKDELLQTTLYIIYKSNKHQIVYKLIIFFILKCKVR